MELSLQTLWGDQEPSNQEPFRLGSQPSGGRNHSRRAAEVGHREPPCSTPSSSMRRSLRGEVGCQGPGACKAGEVEKERGRRNVGRQPERDGRRVGSPEERSRRSRARKRRRGGEERKEKEEEKEGKERKKLGVEQSRPRKGQRGEEEAFFSEGASCGVRQYGIRSRSPGAKAPVEEVEKENEKEERVQLRQQWELLGGELPSVDPELQRLRTGVRGDPQSQEVGPQGPRSPDFQYGQRDAKAAADRCGHLVEHREGVGSAHSATILQGTIGPQAERRSQPRGADALLGARHGPSGQNSPGSRLPEPETEISGNDGRRCQLDGVAKGGDCTPRAGAPLQQGRGAGSRQGGEAGKQNQADGEQRKRKMQNRPRSRTMASQWKRRSERQGERQRQKRQREGGRQEELLGRGVTERGGPLLSDIKGVDPMHREFVDPHDGPFVAHGKILHRGPATDLGLVLGDATPKHKKGSGVALNVVSAVPVVNYQFSKEQVGAQEPWSCADDGAALTSPSRCSGGISSHLLGEVQPDSSVRGLKKVAAVEEEVDVSLSAVNLGGSSFPQVSPLVRSLLISVIEQEECRHSKTQPKGDVFPLPTSAHQHGSAARVGKPG